MSASLASKSAGLRLLLIILMLALPMILFGGIYFQQAKQHIAFIERERLGTELTQIALAQHFAYMRQIPETALNHIKTIERQLNVPEEESYESHFYQLASGAGRDVPDAEVGHDHGNKKITGYIADIASTSGLILDSEAASFHLASALAVSLPNLIGDADEVIKQLNLKDSGPNARFQTGLLLGHMQAAVQRLEEYLNRSKLALGSKAEFEKIDASFKLIDAAIVHFNNQLFFGMASGDAVILRQQLWDIRTASQMMLVPGYELLNTMLDERKDMQKRHLLFFCILGAFSALAALGLAASMFSKTLRRLDEVETAQKHSEEMRLEATRVNEEVAVLNVNLSQKLRELKSAQDELLNKGKMEQLGQLTATVAHEIRNPLGAVRTSAFLIGRKLQGKNTGVEPQLDRINAGIGRCDAIITQLLDFSRTKQVQTASAKFDDWLEKVLIEDAETLPAIVAIECHLGLGDTEVRFDSGRLRRAVLNLITNACEAMVGKDKDALPAMTKQPKVTIRTRIFADEAIIEVVDNGPGMAVDVLERIREPLFTTKNFGTGLGVPAVEQIALQHGGRLDIESAPGIGSKFSICLPLVNSMERDAA